MPGGDRTGPAGMGPMTGRGAGFCAGYGAPGFTNPVPGGWGYGRGGGWGFGRGGGGRGRRNWFYATGLTGWQRAAYGTPPLWGAPYGAPAAAPAMAKEDELAALKGQAEYYEDVLNGLQTRIAELEAESKEK